MGNFVKSLGMSVTAVLIASLQHTALAKSPSATNSNVGLPRISHTSAPPVPQGYEVSTRPKSGIANLVVGEKSGTVKIGQPWTRTITFSSSPIRIHGATYSIPTQFHNERLFILPIDRGIVWAPAYEQQSNTQKPKGSTPIYFTPYHSSTGSLADGAVLIAQLPHRWVGFDGPVVASAWAGWLPQTKVEPAIIQSLTVRQLTFTSTNQVKTDKPFTTNFSRNWPSLFANNVPQMPSGKADYVADVGILQRITGGFILQVAFTDITRSGRNTGMEGQGAYYFWSDVSRKWTPLSQLYMVQTITGDFSAGSDAAYWEEVVPDEHDGLDVAQMHFDPATNTIQSVWLGNWYFWSSFVDGDSWITILANDVTPTTSKRPMWTVYTPH